MNIFGAEILTCVRKRRTKGKTAYSHHHQLRCNYPVLAKKKNDFEKFSFSTRAFFYFPSTFSLPRLSISILAVATRAIFFVAKAWFSLATQAQIKTNAEKPKRAHKNQIVLHLCRLSFALFVDEHEINLALKRRMANAENGGKT